MQIENNEFLDESLPIIEDEGSPETPTSLAQSWGFDVEQQTLLLEKAVKYGQRMIQARNTLLRMFTYSEDWSVFGEGDKTKACLSAAGVLRIVDKANFPIRYHNVQSKKEWIKDKDNVTIGYRYVFDGYATLGQRSIYAIGQYSTREAFLGKRSGEWRDMSEINESHIRQAAHTYFKGNAAKDLLGLKNIPLAEYEALTNAAGQNVEKSSTVSHNAGGQGGVSNEDREKQNQIISDLTELAESGLVFSWCVEKGKDSYLLGTPSDELDRYINDKGLDPVDTFVKSSMKALTTWTDKEGKTVQGHTNLARIKAKQASIMLVRIKDLREKAGV